MCCWLKQEGEERVDYRVFEHAGVSLQRIVLFWPFSLHLLAVCSNFPTGIKEE